MNPKEIREANKKQLIRDVNEFLILVKFRIERGSPVKFVELAEKKNINPRIVSYMQQIGLLEKISKMSWKWTENGFTTLENAELLVTRFSMYRKNPPFKITEKAVPAQSLKSYELQFEQAPAMGKKDLSLSKPISEVLPHRAENCDTKTELARLAGHKKPRKVLRLFWGMFERVTY